MSLREMFSKRKQPAPVPPLRTLTELYNEIANSSMSNLSLEQNGRTKEALAGWEVLHETFGDKFTRARNEFADSTFTDEELFLQDEISVLQAQADDHLERLRGIVESEDRIRRQRQKQQQQQSQLHPSSHSRPSPSLMTLRANSHKKSMGGRPMLKSLRSGGGGAPPKAESQSLTSVSSGSSAYSTPARQAANLIWSPSSSLTAGRSYSSKMAQNHSNQNSQSDPFENFDSDFVVTDRETTKQETLQKLRKQPQPQPQPTNVVRTNKVHTNGGVDDLADQLASLSAAPPQPPQLKTYRSAPQVQQQHYKSSSERARAALQKSAAVKLNIPGPTRVQRRPHPSPPNGQSSQSQQQKQVSTSAASNRLRPPAQRKTPSPLPSPSPRSTSPKRELVLSENSTKDTETLGSDEGDRLDDEKLIRSLKGVDPVAARQILTEIVVNGDEVHWDDIAGLEEAKKSLKETVVYPFLRPDLFSGLREPARGMLLFGPPGTGKTMLARAVATESQSTFFSISASSLTSKYLGESEKLVRALFQLAKRLAPSIIFVDEIDSLLGTRNNEGENEASRRIKNEFLVQWSDLTKAAAGRDQGEDLQRVLVLAATNLPWSIDEAARRRFVRRQYIPLPEESTRRVHLERLLSHQKHTLSESEMHELLQLTEGFSGSDITALAKDAAMGPLRELGDKLLMTSKSEIRPLQLKDFVNSLKYIRPSVSKGNLSHFEEWAKVYGSSGA
ncbi:DEKNAAC103005 [Brettanomyces naardenensis]|uniref:DEKNAAC103005 n=1 Tax=Brettanomyces naardenensis TaxID=13370 RepID=A0A448YM63_BRENA|nr:DEKNAAC103005 [Brettanomyces naardenensis]